MYNKRLFWGVILVVIGGLLLLDNLGVLAPLRISFKQLLFPLALIGFGAWILWASTHAQAAFATQEVSIPLEADEAQVNIDFGGGELIVAGRASAATLLSGTFDGVEYHVTSENGVQRVHLTSPLLNFPRLNFGMATPRRWAMALNPDVRLSLGIKTGACDVRLDLRELRVSRLTVETGASSTHIIAPAHAGYTEIRGSSGAASISVEVPEGVAACIHVAGALSSISVDQGRFPHVGGEYRSPDYETAPNKVDIKLEGGVGTFSVR
ncbi:MAG TPA: DUF5668 domain-containing protein [Anaerolineae bacterium]|nr:DUF5668 domain-containing protein [Anaerolineae bacterium]HQK12860.1 DUF5668 domain-containing protein [Anaerolineae bacterium]